MEAAPKARAAESGFMRNEELNSSMSDSAQVRHKPPFLEPRCIPEAHLGAMAQLFPFLRGRT